jgi:hypothetical protein
VALESASGMGAEDLLAAGDLLEPEAPWGAHGPPRTFGNLLIITG